MIEPPQHDAHVAFINKLFRDAGVTMDALAYPRPPEAVAALRRFNGVPEGAVTPPAWRYFPNRWLADNWRDLYARWLPAAELGARR